MSSTLQLLSGFSNALSQGNRKTNRHELKYITFKFPLHFIYHNVSSHFSHNSYFASGKYVLFINFFIYHTLPVFFVFSEVKAV